MITRIKNSIFRIVAIIGVFALFCTGISVNAASQQNKSNGNMIISANAFWLHL